MLQRNTPEAGEWYKTPDKQIFKILSVDEADDTIVIQYSDGTLEEVDFESWIGMDLEPKDYSADWPSSFDELDVEDMEEKEEPDVAWSDPDDEG